MWESKFDNDLQIINRMSEEEFLEHYHWGIIGYREDGYDFHTNSYIFPIYKPIYGWVYNGDTTITKEMYNPYKLFMNRYEPD